LFLVAITSFQDSHSVTALKCRTLHTVSLHLPMTLTYSSGVQVINLVFIRLKWLAVNWEAVPYSRMSMSDQTLPYIVEIMYLEVPSIHTLHTLLLIQVLLISVIPWNIHVCVPQSQSTWQVVMVQAVSSTIEDSMKNLTGLEDNQMHQDPLVRWTKELLGCSRTVLMPKES
jgi:hypothetical protein